MKLPIIIFLSMMFFMNSYAEGQSNKEFFWSNSGPGESDFLIPKGWFLKKESKGDTYAFFITQEDIDKEGVFQTGFTVNVLKGTSHKTKFTASQYAHRFISIVAQEKNNKVLLSPWFFKIGPFKGYGVRVQDKVKVMHYMLIANDKKDTLFLTFFEARSQEWDDAWKYGKTIVNNMKLDDEV